MITNDEIQLKSGKKIYANEELVSIRFNDKDEPELSEGYDGNIYLVSHNLTTGKYDKPEFTKDELIELAEIMIARWQKLIYKVNSNEVPIIK